MSSIKVIGLDTLLNDIDEMARRLVEEQGVEVITKGLAASMRKHVHVRTGYLKSTIYHRGNIAGARAPYAGIEADRGDSHDYAQQAIDDFRMDRYADYIWEPVE